MRICIFGMGYVGVVSAACLARDGHYVVGVDPVESKVKDLASGQTPIQEPGIATLIAASCRAGLLTATTSPEEGLAGSDMVWICVGTPSQSDGGINLSHVKTAAAQIGQAMKNSLHRPLIVLRSTSLPGSTRELLIPTLEAASGLQAGKDFQVVFHPEFLREATAIRDFDDPPKIVIGEHTSGAAQRLLDVYQKYPGPRFCLALEEAEMVKYSDNLFHALKVTFANEIGAIARSANVDARRVAEVFCADTKLNISPRYLRPGFAFGGSCLPKDLKAILRYASLQSVKIPMLQAMMESNRSQIETLLARVLGHRPKSVGMVGLAFKANTDDMRESPFVVVAKRVLGEGLRLRVYDPGVNPERLIGANKQAVQGALGHLEGFLVNSMEELGKCDLILINHAIVDAAQVHAWLAAGVGVIDLAGIKGIHRITAGYEGINW